MNLGGISMAIDDDARDRLRDLVIDKSDEERLIFLKCGFCSRAMPASTALTHHTEFEASWRRDRLRFQLSLMAPTSQR